VRGIDIAPTVLGALAKSLPSGFEGRDVLAFWPAPAGAAEVWSSRDVTTPAGVFALPLLPGLASFSRAPAELFSCWSSALSEEIRSALELARCLAEIAGSAGLSGLSGLSAAGSAAFSWTAMCAASKATTTSARLAGGRAARPLPVADLAAESSASSTETNSPRVLAEAQSRIIALTARGTPAPIAPGVSVCGMSESA